MKTIAWVLAVALSSCATASPHPAPLALEPDPCKAMAVEHASGADGVDLGEGVWMCTGLAAKKAGSCATSEDGLQRCQKALSETSGWSWQPLVTGLVLGLAAGAAGGIGIYAASHQPVATTAPVPPPVSTLQQAQRQR